MSRKIVYIATSLDSFIARKNGDIDWLEEDPSYDYYNEFIKNVEVILMGATTYEKVMSFGIDWPYPEQTSYVFTHKKDHADERNIKFTDEDIISLVEKLQTETTGDIWIMGGSDLINQFLRKGLVDEIVIGIQPIILGEGIPLFTQPDEIRLELTKVSSYDKGMIQVHYNVIG
ncbi:MAG: dihydrofolate reductase family protein [Methanolobus sp.]|uniref:dihydrofolate reductase family protein n=1 Tax=Methanolobus sp. TaxID=1874737 RepID=UPI0027321F33|nr:dihydrofolate reductase family protein [Methanolobus sp.]MDP2217745.1 dihydrofolate reductase family protein [Methanolobus sp.]